MGVEPEKIPLRNCNSEGKFALFVLSLGFYAVLALFGI